MKLIILFYCRIDLIDLPPLPRCETRAPTALRVSHRAHMQGKLQDCAEFVLFVQYYKSFNTVV